MCFKPQKSFVIVLQGEREITFLHCVSTKSLLSITQRRFSVSLFKASRSRKHLIMIQHYIVRSSEVITFTMGINWRWTKIQHRDFNKFMISFFCRLLQTTRNNAFKMIRGRSKKKEEREISINNIELESFTRLNGFFRFNAKS